MSMFSSLPLVGCDGRPVDAARLEGKAVLLYFSASWCGPCKRFTPALRVWYDALVAEGEPLEIVFVSRDKTPEEAQAYMKDHMGPWCALDYSAPAGDELARLFGIRGIPQAVVVDSLMQPQFSADVGEAISEMFKQPTEEAQVRVARKSFAGMKKMCGLGGEGTEAAEGATGGSAATAGGSGGASGGVSGSSSAAAAAACPGALRAALRACRSSLSPQACSTLRAIGINAAKDDAKYRSLKSANKAIAERVLAHAPAVEALKAMGWAEADGMWSLPQSAVVNQGTLAAFDELVARPLVFGGARPSRAHPRQQARATRADAGAGAALPPPQQIQAVQLQAAMQAAMANVFGAGQPQAHGVGAAATTPAPVPAATPAPATTALAGEDDAAMAARLQAEADAADAALAARLQAEEDAAADAEATPGDGDAMQ